MLASTTALKHSVSGLGSLSMPGNSLLNNLMIQKGGLSSLFGKSSDPTNQSNLLGGLL